MLPPIQILAVLAIDFLGQSDPTLDVTQLDKGTHESLVFTN